MFDTKVIVNTCVSYINYSNENLFNGRLPFEQSMKGYE